MIRTFTFFETSDSITCGPRIVLLLLITFFVVGCERQSLPTLEQSLPTLDAMQKGRWHAIAHAVHWELGEKGQTRYRNILKEDRPADLNSPFFMMIPRSIFEESWYRLTSYSETEETDGSGGRILVVNGSIQAIDAGGQYSFIAEFDDQEIMQTVRSGGVIIYSDEANEMPIIISAGGFYSVPRDRIQNENGK